MHFVLLTTLTFITPTFQQTTYNTSTSSCTIVGDPSLYGGGIRSSFYFLFFSGILASLLKFEAELTLARRLYNLISIATIISLYANSAKNDTFLAFEWFLVFILVILPLFVTVPLERLFQRPDKLSLALLFIFYSVFFLIQPWVYFFQLSQGQKSGCTATLCVFFSQVDIHDSHWISFLKASSIIAACGGFVWICTSLTSILLGIRKTSTGKDLEKLGDDQGEKVESFKLPLSWHIGVRFASLFLGCCGIAFVEITLKLNEIHFSSNGSLIETGQLIPFLAGLLSLLNTMWGALGLWLPHGAEISIFHF
ncbi:hypothetical protein F5884DRAFT_861577 [Xylogone sp. PMI_703]|nr:hypothetical protein F5884DRAFT_861577 [Xylogone sp. PMI_703]